jgi:hypothetical protein
MNSKHKYEQVEHLGYKINIYQDDDAQSPDDWGDDDVFLVHYHREFAVRRDDIITEEDCREFFAGEKIAQDAESYRYLAESIRMHPDAEALKNMMLEVGFDAVDTHRLTGGIVALHIGIKY